MLYTKEIHMYIYDLNAIRLINQKSIKEFLNKLEVLILSYLFKFVV